MLDEQRAQPDAVVVGHAAQAGVVVAVVVADERRGLVDDRGAVEHGPQQHVEVLAGPRAGAGAEPLVEAAEPQQPRAVEHGVRAGAVGADQVGVERVVETVRVEVEDAPAKALVEAAYVMQELGWRVSAAGRISPVHRPDVGRRRPRLADGPQPARVDGHVVVEEGHGLAAGLAQAAVACP